MANIITAGNSTNGGTAVSTDTSGALNIVTGSGSGANAITIDTSQNVVMTANQSIGGNLTVTGTLTATGGISGGVRSGTAVASTSGTSIDFTGIPSGVKRITIMLANVSTTSTVPITFRLGTSGGIVSTGYAGSQGYVGGTPASTNMSTGFELYNDTAAVTYQGQIVLTLVDTATNTWCAAGVVGVTTQAYLRYIGGYIALGGTLTQVRMTTTTGSPTFDSGLINIMSEG
jgi:hypothetical protein